MRSIRVQWRSLMKSDRGPSGRGLFFAAEDEAAIRRNQNRFFASHLLSVVLFGLPWLTALARSMSSSNSVIAFWARLVTMERPKSSRTTLRPPHGKAISSYFVSFSLLKKTNVSSIFERNRWRRSSLRSCIALTTICFLTSKKVIFLAPAARYGTFSHSFLPLFHSYINLLTKSPYFTRFYLNNRW